MDKKTLAFILIAVGLLAITAGVILFLKGSSKDDNQDRINQSTKMEETAMDKNTKSIVVYFSAQNHTKNVATKIATDLNADIFEIEPAEAYTEDDLSWTDSESRVSREHNDASLQDVALKSISVPDWDEYETVFIGYPIWWGGSAWPVDSFVKQVDFGNKTVIPFCTSHSSELGTSDTDLKAKATGGNWQPGHRFSQDATDSEIKDWIESL
ncbi:flavodoxin [Candidatus Saccharibacteria bacterium]|nr:flavodoxin [Candidatus Saccharibacteria bacterium]